MAHMSQYDTEKSMNNSQAFKILQSVFPGVFNESDIQSLFRAQECLNNISQFTGYGRVIIHKTPQKTTVEVRSYFADKTLDLTDEISYNNNSTKENS